MMLRNRVQSNIVSLTSFLVNEAVFHLIWDNTSDE